MSQSTPQPSAAPDPIDRTDSSISDSDLAALAEMHSQPTEQSQSAQQSTSPAKNQDDVPVSVTPPVPLVPPTAVSIAASPFDTPAPQTELPTAAALSSESPAPASQLNQTEPATPVASPSDAVASQMSQTAPSTPVLAAAAVAAPSRVSMVSPDLSFVTDTAAPAVASAAAPSLSIPVVSASVAVSTAPPSSPAAAVPLIRLNDIEPAADTKEYLNLLFQHVLTISDHCVRDNHGAWQKNSVSGMLASEWKLDESHGLPLFRRPFCLYQLLDPEGSDARNDDASLPSHRKHLPPLPHWSWGLDGSGDCLMNALVLGDVHPEKQEQPQVQLIWDVLLSCARHPVWGTVDPAHKEHEFESVKQDRKV